MWPPNPAFPVARPVPAAGAPGSAAVSLFRRLRVILWSIRVAVLGIAALVVGHALGGW